MASLTIPQLSEDEYLEIDRAALEKSEFYNGRMFAMAGGTPNHSLLANAVGSLLYRQVPPGCRTFNSDLRIKAPAVGLFTYPDCSVVCGDLQYEGNRHDIVLNPLLIVEVLSPSTEDYDRGKKFEWYRSIPSFREYLIVHQDRRHVEHYSKQEDGGWLLREHTDNATFGIPHLGVNIALDELYASAINVD